MPTPTPPETTPVALPAGYAKTMAQWQPQPAEKKAAIADYDPAAKPFSSSNKAADKAAVEALAVEIDALQNMFYADRKRKFLVILQGTDTSGKDGTLRSVFSRVTPLGMHTIGWGVPTAPELAHDYLWRIHQHVPAAGEFMVFNRSHYEDVLVPVVNQWITPEQTRQRYAHINDFERMLTETGTVILKFLLHISYEEQGERLQARLDDPAKHWKFSSADTKVRTQWSQYQQAYEDLLNATSTDWAPWTVVPADTKTHRNLMIALAVRESLRGMDLRFPPLDPALKDLKVI